MSPSASVRVGAVHVPPTDSDEPGTAAAGAAPTRRPRRLGLLLGVLLVAVVGAVFVYLPVLGVDVPSPGDLAGGLPIGVLGAVSAGVLVLGLLVLGLRRRAGRRIAPRSEQVSGPDPDPDADLVPTMDPRALLLYARSLEGTLSDQEDRLEQLRRAADDRRRAELRQEHVRSQATVELMRRVHAHQPGVVALGRTEAAVARLGVEPGFTRPVLPSGPAGTLPVVFGIAPAPEPVPADQPVEPTTGATPEDDDAATRPLAGSGSLAAREAALTAPAEPAPVELTAAGRPKVRPVPPPPDGAQARRGRRRRRGAQD